MSSSSQTAEMPDDELDSLLGPNGLHELDSFHGPLNWGQQSVEGDEAVPYSATRKPYSTSARKTHARGGSGSAAAATAAMCENGTLSVDADGLSTNSESERNTQSTSPRPLVTQTAGARRTLPRPPATPPDSSQTFRRHLPGGYKAPRNKGSSPRGLPLPKTDSVGEAMFDAIMSDNGLDGVRGSSAFFTDSPPPAPERAGAGEPLAASLTVERLASLGQPTSPSRVSRHSRASTTPETMHPRSNSKSSSIAMLGSIVGGSGSGSLGAGPKHASTTSRSSLTADRAGGEGRRGARARGGGGAGSSGQSNSSSSRNSSRTSSASRRAQRSGHLERQGSESTGGPRAPASAAPNAGEQSPRLQQQSSGVLPRDSSTHSYSFMGRSSSTSAGSNASPSAPTALRSAPMGGYYGGSASARASVDRLFHLGSLDWEGSGTGLGASTEMVALQRAETTEELTAHDSAMNLRYAADADRSSSKSSGDSDDEASSSGGSNDSRRGSESEGSCGSHGLSRPTGVSKGSGGIFGDMADAGFFQIDSGTDSDGEASPEAPRGLSKPPLHGGPQTQGGGAAAAQGVKRRLIPLDYLRELYQIEAYLGEDEVSQSYRVRERNTGIALKRKLVARFFFTDKGKNFFSKNEHRNRAARSDPRLSQPLCQQVALALLLDHPKLVRSYDFFYHSADDAKRIQAKMQCVLTAGAVPAKEGDDNGASDLIAPANAHLNPRMYAKGELGLVRKRVSLLTSEVLLPHRASLGNRTDLVTHGSPRGGHDKAVVNGNGRAGGKGRGHKSLTSVEEEPTVHAKGKGGRSARESKLPVIRGADSRRPPPQTSTGRVSQKRVPSTGGGAGAPPHTTAGASAASPARDKTAPLQPMKARAHPAGRPAPPPTKTPRQKLDELFVKLNNQVYGQDEGLPSNREGRSDRDRDDVRSGDAGDGAHAHETADMDLLFDPNFIYGVLVSDLVAGSMPPAMQAEMRNRSGAGNNGGLDEHLVRFYTTELCEVLTYMHTFAASLGPAASSPSATFTPAILHNNLRAESLLVDSLGAVRVAQSDSAALLTARAYFAEGEQHQQRRRSDDKQGATDREGEPVGPLRRQPSLSLMDLVAFRGESQGSRRAETAASIPFPITPLDLTAPAVYTAPELAHYTAVLRSECEKQRSRRVEVLGPLGDAAQLMELSRPVTTVSFASFNYKSSKLIPDLVEAVTPAVDCYQLGIMLYRLLLGDLPRLVPVPASPRTAGHSAPHARLELDSHPQYRNLTPEARDLLTRLLTVPAQERLTIPQVLAHPFVTGTAGATS